MSTGYVWHEEYMWHDTTHVSQMGWYPAGIRRQFGQYNQPWQHYENAETKRRMHNLLAVTGLMEHLTPIAPIRASVEQLAAIHTPAYIERIQVLSDTPGGGDAGEAAPVGVGSYDIARLAAGGAIAAVEAVVSGKVQNAYALVRPPGHHAERDIGRGFCIFNNIAIAAAHARKSLGIQRVAIVDWDVHHGNGTQQAFYDDPSVLFISIHQDGMFPANSGHVHQVGQGSGEGFNINIPIPPGSGIGCYASATDRVIVPALRAFRPELILISCGFDAAAFDPIAHCMLNSSAFARLARSVKAVSDELCSGRLVMMHEGGYSETAVPFAGLRVLEEMSGRQTGCVDPYNDEIEVLPYQALQPHQEAVIAAAEAIVKKYLLSST